MTDRLTAWLIDPQAPRCIPIFVHSRISLSNALARSLARSWVRSFQRAGCGSLLPIRFVLCLTRTQVYFPSFVGATISSFHTLVPTLVFFRLLARSLSRTLGPRFWIVGLVFAVFCCSSACRVICYITLYGRSRISFFHTLLFTVSLFFSYARSRVSSRIGSVKGARMDYYGGPKYIGPNIVGKHSEI